MGLAIFDLDNTLIAGDSDYLWGEFLVEKGVVDRAYYESENLRYYEEYKAGTLDIMSFLQFSLKPLSEHSMDQLLDWREQFFQKKIAPIMLAKAKDLLNNHRKRGDTLLVITATNTFVTQPVVSAYGIEHLLGTIPACVNNRFTGEIEGIPTFQQGKVTRYHQWIEENNLSFDETWFYSDSHNDMPLLELVDHPVTVDADQQLSTIATDRGWSQISLR